MDLLVGAVLVLLVVAVALWLFAVKDMKAVAVPVVLGVVAVVVGYLVEFDYHWWVALVVAVVALYLAVTRRSMPEFGF